MTKRPISSRIATALRKFRELIFSKNKLEYIKEEMKWRRFYSRLSRENEENLAFDRKYGTETAAEILLTETGVTAEQAAAGNGLYRPFWKSDFLAAIAFIPQPIDQFTFIDMGSGKGKLLLLASDFNFKKIIGVEYSPVLDAIAKNNISIYRSDSQVCFDVTSVCCDAQTYEIPDEPLIILIFNALQEPIMKRALDNIESSAAMRNQPIYLIYANLRDVSEIGSALEGRPLFSTLFADRKRVVMANALALHHFHAGRGGVSQPQ